MVTGRPFFTTDPIVLLASRNATYLAEIDSEFAGLEKLTLETQSSIANSNFFAQSLTLILRSLVSWISHSDS